MSVPELAPGDLEHAWDWSKKKVFVHASLPCTGRSTLLNFATKIKQKHRLEFLKLLEELEKYYWELQKFSFDPSAPSKDSQCPSRDCGHAVRSPPWTHLVHLLSPREIFASDRGSLWFGKAAMAARPL